MIASEARTLTLFEPSKWSLTRVSLSWGSGHERRAEPRFETRHGGLVHLSWDDQRGSFEIASTFENLSRGGAAVRTESPILPQVSMLVRVQTQGRGTQITVLAEVCEIIRALDGSARVRLRFAEPCPMAQVETIVSRWGDSPHLDD